MKEFLGLLGWTEEATQVVKGVANGLSAIFEVILQPDMSLEELAGTYSEKIDDLIIAEMRKGLTYAGGSLDVAYLNEASFHIQYELYFQDKNKEWVKKEAKSQPQKMSYLNAKALEELREKKKVSFEIDLPNQEKTKHVKKNQTKTDGKLGASED